MKSRSLAILLAMGLAVFSAASAQGEEQGMPTIRIASPEDGENVTGPDLELTVEVQNFTLTEEPSTPPEPTEGYYEVYVDGTLAGQSTNDTFTVENVTAGAHEVMVQLVTADGTPVTGPDAQDMVTVNVTEEGEGPEEVGPPETPGFTLLAAGAATVGAAGILGLRRRRR